ncbi:MAG: hypothetical protein ACK5KT_13210 [Dysgonomonas sp.]
MDKSNIMKKIKEEVVPPVAAIVLTLLLSAGSILYLFYWIGEL